MRVGVDADGHTFYPVFDGNPTLQPEELLIFSHDVDVFSAFAPVKPFPTFCAPGNVCTVDYIFVSKEFEVTRWHMLPHDILSLSPGIPNDLYPSDHFSMTIELSNIISE
jgi:endonuclease/exonuclease/phosphatase family metal-dependent hydrolase